MRYGQETIKFRTPSLWVKLPEEYKLANSLNIFKRKIKNWKFETCPVVYAKLFKNIMVLSNFNYLFVCLFIYFFVYLFFFVVCFFCLESLFILFYFTIYTACFIVVATFLQFPLLWREWMHEFSTCEFKWWIWTDLQIIIKTLRIN